MAIAVYLVVGIIGLFFLALSLPGLDSPLK